MTLIRQIGQRFDEVVDAVWSGMRFLLVDIWER